ncbi:bile salt-activated lipase-like [Babylonia areolata]|uniref:bile salt-activated lipase-like n=1 Tax=Babylonia areolata TaxID=304850 RepID=UPI003FD6B908
MLMATVPVTFPSGSIGWRVTDFIFVPCVDGDFIPDHPQNLMKNSTYLQQVGFYELDYLSGVTNNEGALIYEMAARLVDDPNQLLADPDFFDLDLVKVLLTHRFGHTNVAMETIVSFFYTAPRLHNGTALNLNDVMLSDGDVEFYVPLVEHARAVAAAARADKRNLVYHFNHFPKYLTPELSGTPHGLDVVLYEVDRGRAVVAALLGNASLWDADDDWMVAAYRSIIVDFVTFSDPAKSLRSVLNSDWPDFDLVNESYLSLSPHNASVLLHPFARRVALWLDLLPKFKDKAGPKKAMENC